MSVRRVRSNDGVRGLVVAMDDLEGVRGKVGWFESAHYPNGRSVAENAATHEFGAPQAGIPPRPFMRPTIDREKDKWSRQIGEGARSVLAGQRTARQVLEVVMVGAAGDVGKSIQAVTSPPLKPETVKRKGFAKPLIDTSLMFQSVTGVVEDDL